MTTSKKVKPTKRRGQQKPTEWKPTLKQQELAAKLAMPDAGMTIVKACELANVDRTMYYKWIKVPEFRRYVEDLRKHGIFTVVGKAWSGLGRLCDKDDFEAIQYVLENAGDVRPQSKNQPMAPAVVVNNNTEASAQAGATAKAYPSLRDVGVDKDGIRNIRELLLNGREDD